MKSIELQFYEFCNDNGIFIKDSSSLSSIERAKLMMKNKNKTFDITDYAEAYKKGELESDTLKAKAKIDDAILPIFNEGTVRNKFIKLSGREHYIACIKRRIEENETLIESMILSAMSPPLKESDWAIMGGIASGIAGGAAGLAVAVDVQRRNAEIRQYNEQLRHSRARALAYNKDYQNAYYREQNLNKELENAKNCLVDDSQSSVFFDNLKINEPSMFIFPDNRYVIFADYSKDDFVIFGDVKAEIRGILTAEIYDGTKLITTVDACLPTHRDKFEQTIISAGVIKHHFINKPVVKFINKNIWAIEKDRNYYPTNKNAQTDEVLEYVRDNNENIIKLGLENTKKEYQKAKNLIHSAETSDNTSYKLNYYNSAINILKTIPDWNDSTQLINDCKQKTNILNTTIKTTNNKNSKTIFIILGALIIIIAVALFITKDSRAYNSAKSELDAKNYYTAYSMFTELGDYKDSHIIAEEIELYAFIDSLKTLEPGDVVTFGRYEQDNNLENGPENIEWEICSIIDNVIRLESKYVLDFKYIHPDRDKAVLWENSYIREWLNNDFYNQAFNDDEKAFIMEDSRFQSIHENGRKEDWIKANFNPLQIVNDKVYLDSGFSHHYFPTEYAQANPECVLTASGYCELLLTDSVMITYGYSNGKLYNMTTPLASHYDTDKDEYEDYTIYNNSVGGVVPSIRLDLSLLK